MKTIHTQDEIMKITRRAELFASSKTFKQYLLTSSPGVMYVQDLN